MLIIEGCHDFFRIDYDYNQQRCVLKEIRDKIQLFKNNTYQEELIHALLNERRDVFDDRLENITRNLLQNCVSKISDLFLQEENTDHRDTQCTTTKCIIS